jgi:hypothetical protein
LNDKNKENNAKDLGKYVREHQLICASASTTFKAPLYVKEALSG